MNEDPIGSKSTSERLLWSKPMKPKGFHILGTQLSLDEQLWLIARIAQRLRAQLVAQNPLGAQLAAMAADPEIQNELRAIAEGFASAEADGLEPE